jgi:heme/copper-type cytochrome/quinol oxidase subunit 3
MSAYDASVRVPRNGTGARPNGWWGMAIFVASESTLFGTLVGTYLYLEAQSRHWPPNGVQRPALTAPLLLTGLLLVSAPLLLRAASAAQAGHRSAAWRSLAVATVVQGVYLGWQLHEYLTQLHQFSPRASSYASIYFTLLAAAHLHVLAGVIMSCWLLARLAGGLTRYRIVGLRAVVFYWLVVDVITVVVLVVQISPRL